MDPPEPDETASTGGRLTGAEAVKLHLTLVAVMALCLTAFWFEVGRALGGNELSWAYVFEWPIFAAFAVYLWWTTLHQSRRKKQGASPKVVAPEHVQMLKNWQEHRRTMAAAETDALAGRAGRPPGADSSP